MILLDRRLTQVCFSLAYERCTSANFERTLDSWALFGSVAWQLSTGRITGINADGSLNVA